MIPFEKASTLKKGEVVYAAGYKVTVVKTDVDASAKTVVITYSDGSDQFVGRNEVLSLTAPAAAKSQADEPVKVKPPAKPKAVKPKSKPARPRPLPLPTSGDIGERIKAGYARHEQWRSLDYFEEDRMKIAKAVSSELNIPIEEFDGRPESASFHFLTLCMAIAVWVRSSSDREREMLDEREMNQFERLARSKVMSGIFVRLFCHPYVQDLGSVPGFGKMASSFADAVDLSPSAFLQLQNIFAAHTFVRESVLTMARHFADGSPQGDEAPMSMEFFEPFEQLLERDEDKLMPRDAAVDASLQIVSALEFLHGKATLPVSLETLPAKDSQAHQFVRNYLALAAMHRMPSVFKAGKFTVGEAMLADALDSLTDEQPLVLLDSIFKDGDNILIVMPMNPHSESQDAAHLAAAVSDATEQLPCPPKISWAMYPAM